MGAETQRPKQGGRPTPLGLARESKASPRSDRSVHDPKALTYGAAMARVDGAAGKKRQTFLFFGTMAFMAFGIAGRIDRRASRPWPTNRNGHRVVRSSKALSAPGRVSTRGTLSVLGFANAPPGRPAGHRAPTPGAAIGALGGRGLNRDRSPGWSFRADVLRSGFVASQELFPGIRSGPVG